MSNLDIFWIRHAISCNNIRSNFKKIYEYHYIDDPSIILDSSIAIIDYKTNDKFPKELSNNTHIFCSEMLRAIQTAIISFPNQFLNNKIKIIPGINEKGIGKGNKVYPQNKVKKELLNWIVGLFYLFSKNDLYKDEKYKNYKLFSLFNKKSNHSDLKNIKLNYKSLIDNLYSINNQQNFKTVKNIYEEENIIIPLLNLYCLKNKIKKVAIISHSKYIYNYVINKEKQNYSRKKGNVYNNNIIHKYYKFSLDNQIIKSKIILSYSLGFLKKNKIIYGFYDKNSYEKLMNNLDMIKNNKKTRKRMMKNDIENSKSNKSNNKFKKYYSKKIDYKNKDIFCKKKFNKMKD